MRAGTLTAPASNVQEQLDLILQRVRVGNCKLEYADTDLLLRNSENAAVKETLGPCNNGESRLRALTCLPDILHLESFISTHVKYADNFKHLPLIENFEQFCEICRSPIGTEYLFTTTDQDAPYGIFWYEYNSQKTAPVTPGEQTCRKTLSNYLKQNSNTVFTIDWFNNPVDWTLYLEKHEDNFWL